MSRVDPLLSPFDPSGTYLVAQGGQRYTDRGCTVVWATDRLDDPLATLDLGGRDLFFHPDGVLLAETGGVSVLSLTGKTDILRRMTSDQVAVRYMLGNPETGHLYTMNMRGELWQWDMAREAPSALPEVLREFERRSRMRLDADGRFRLMDHDSERVSGLGENKGSMTDCSKLSGSAGPSREDGKKTDGYWGRGGWMKSHR